MSKPASLSEEAYNALKAQKLTDKESLSEVILRFVHPPIRTFGDLERHLERMEGALIPDLAALRRVRKGRRAH